MCDRQMLINCAMPLGLFRLRTYDRMGLAIGSLKASARHLLVQKEPGVGMVPSIQIRSQHHPGPCEVLVNKNQNLLIALLLI